LSLVFLLFPQLGPCTQLVLKDIFPIVRVELHDNEFAVIDVAQIFEIFNTPVIPFHQKDPRHESMGYQYADTGKIILPE
jgi:hypothetical protein